MRIIKKIINNINGNVILSHKENGYQEVINSFNESSYIKIVTYNINTYEPSSNLIKELRSVSESIPITLILNIPARRDDYINKRTGNIIQEAVEKAGDGIKFTLNVLERSKFGDLTVYFNFENHSKLIMTDKIAYIGSQNFSDASQNNYELGILISDIETIQALNQNIFEEIKNKSVLYTTSYYNHMMNDASEVIKFSLHEMRQSIFTWVGDEPYIPEIEILDIENAHFPKGQWEVFKSLHHGYEIIVEKLIADYPDEFNKKVALAGLQQLQSLIEELETELDDLAHFVNNVEDGMLWDKFRENDMGDNMESALESATEYVREHKQQNFAEIEEIGERLIHSFDKIEECIISIKISIDEIRDDMIKKSIYKNIELIRNF